MNSRPTPFDSKPSVLYAWAGKPIVGVRTIFRFATILIWLFVRASYGEDRQFSFDAHGNLVAQTTETITSPQILGQPQDQVVVPGGLGSFFVVVANSRALTYQWQFNGLNIGGATGDALLVTNVNGLNEGSYSVVLANTSGSVTSAPAALMLDSDADGLGDSWELMYFGSLNQNSTGDSDGDGTSNLSEFLGGTNPTNSASALYLLTVLTDGGAVHASPSRLYYTNGEEVTLTAIALAADIFHGWTGDVVSRTNPLVLVIATNTTLTANFKPRVLTWTNAVSGSWHNPSNWSPNLVPTIVDDVFVSSGVTVSINEPAVSENLTFTAGTLTGTDRLTIYGDGTWTGGSMTGSGRTVIEAGGTLTINNASSLTLNNRTLENAGTILWTSGNVNLNAAVITNRAGALVENRGVGGLVFGGGSPRFDNAGIFRKTVNAGAISVSSAFNNYNLAEIQTGTLVLDNGGLNNGSIDVPAGTTLDFSGGTFTGNVGSSITGDGQLKYTSGTANLAGLVNVTGTQTISGGTLNTTGNYICTNNTLTISSGTANFSGSGPITPNVMNLSGTLAGSQVVTVLTGLNWTAGTMSGSGRTIIPPGVTLTLANPVAVGLTTRTLENAGTILWTGAGININAAVITNRAGALIENRGVGGLVFNGGTPRFDNAGAFRKTVNAGAISVSSAFNNYNIAEIQTGTLVLDNGGLNNGSIDVPAGTTLDFSGGTFTGNVGSSITGDGQLKYTSGTANLAGLVNVTGTQTISGGTLNTTGNYICTNNTLTISSGTANFSGSGPITPNVMNLSGTLAGSQVVTVLAGLNWTAGTMSGSGRTIIPPGVTLTLANPAAVSLTTRTLENAGTILWTGAGINMNASVITNRAGALVENRGVGGLVFGGGTPRFDNAGIFRKTVNAGAISVSSAFNNYNLAEIQTGTLVLDNGGLNNGSIDVPGGTVLDFSGGTFTGSVSSSITGDGQLRYTSGTANLAGLVNVRGTQTISGGTLNTTGNYICTNNTLTLSSGTANFSGSGPITPNVMNLSGTLSGSQVVTVLAGLNWTAGTMSGSGRTIIPPGVTLTLANPAAVSLTTRTLENAGTMLWTGAGININAAVITNRAGALVENRGAGGLAFNGGTPRFDNAGTFRKTVNTGTMSAGIAFNNSGVVELRNGILSVTGGYVSTSGASLACSLGGTNAGTGYARLQVSGAVALNGSLSVDFATGFSPATNDTFTVVTAGTRTGSFAIFSYPSNDVTMVTSNTATSVIVRVTDVFVRPRLLPPEITGSAITLTWTAISNTVYRLEYTLDPGLSTWTALPGDVTAVTNTAGKVDTLTSSNRFYRVHVIP